MSKRNHGTFWLDCEIKSLRDRRGDVKAGDLNPYEYAAVAAVLLRAADYLDDGGSLHLKSRAEDEVAWGARAALA